MTAPLMAAAPLTTTRVIIAVGSRLACDAYTARVGAEEDLLVIPVQGTATTVFESIPTLAPAVVVIDPRATDDGDTSLVSRVLTLSKRPSVVALFAENDRQLATRLLRDGVSAAVLKTAPAEELVSAIRWAAIGTSWVSPRLLRHVLDELHNGSKREDERLQQLSPREREILQLMVDGLGRKQMAARLYLSVDTIRSHTRTIMEKLDVHSATSAVSVALAAGLRPCA
jgi:DNA-binding NarL/FixJ family response regulator